MKPGSSSDLPPGLDTDFVLLPDTLNLAQALGPILSKPGRLGIVQTKEELILGALDAYGIARALTEHEARGQALHQIQLQKVLEVDESADWVKVIHLFQEDLHRPIIMRGEGGRIMGHLTSLQMLRWFIAQEGGASEKLVQLQQELERRDEYLGIVSHDLRAPLSVIQLAVDYILFPEHFSTLSVPLQSFVERIKRNTDNAQFLVRGLLDSLHIQGGMQLSFDQVIYSDLIDDAVKSLSLVAQQKKQTIEAWHVDEIKVSLDSGRMRQVLENLIMNAIKYSPVGGRIKVQSRLEEREGVSHAVVKVSNPGRNISAAEGGKLLAPFVRGVHAKGLRDGVGLGLSIVQKVIELHEGFIEVGSDNPNEVCFQVFLPNASSVLSTQRDQLIPDAQVILVVDDDEDILEFTEGGLTDAGFHVHTATDGARAYSQFQRHKPHLVISDIRMARMDGFELLARIRESNPHTPVILFSGFYSGLERELQHTALQPDLFLDKPFRMSELVAQVRRLLSASSVGRAS